MADEKTVRKNLKRLFEDIDQNADGTLSKEELHEFLSYKDLTDQQIEELTGEKATSLAAG